jgi:hypothetical protein
MSCHLLCLRKLLRLISSFGCDEYLASLGGCSISLTDPKANGMAKLEMTFYMIDSRGLLPKVQGTTIERLYGNQDYFGSCAHPVRLSDRWRIRALNPTAKTLNSYQSLIWMASISNSDFVSKPPTILRLSTTNLSNSTHHHRHKRSPSHKYSPAQEERR